MNRSHYSIVVWICYHILYIYDKIFILYELWIKIWIQHFYFLIWPICFLSVLFYQFIIIVHILLIYLNHVICERKIFFGKKSYDKKQMKAFKKKKRLQEREERLMSAQNMFARMSGSTIRKRKIKNEKMKKLKKLRLETSEYTFHFYVIFYLY